MSDGAMDVRLDGDQNTSTRPRRSAAVEAQAKVEESYEIWGQPLPDKEAGRIKVKRKRSAARESSAGRKRARDSLQHQAESTNTRTPPETEGENDTLTQPVERGPGGSRKNLARQQTFVAFEVPSKKITLRVPDSSSFTQSLRKIRDREYSSVSSSEPQAAGQAVVTTVTDKELDFPKQAEPLGVVASAREVPTTSHTFNLFPTEPFDPSKSKSGYSLGHVHVQRAEGWQNEARKGRSRTGAKTGAADHLDGLTRISPTNSELRDMSELVTQGGGGDHAQWLDQQKADTDIQEIQRPNTRPSSTTSPLSIEHTHPAPGLSPTVQLPRGFAGTREMHDLVMSKFDSVQRRNQSPAWQHSPREIEAIHSLAAQMEREITLSEKDRMTIYLEDSFSTQQRESLTQYQTQPLVYRFRNEAVVQHFHQKKSDDSVQVISPPATSSAIHQRARVSNEHVWRPRSNSAFWPDFAMTNTTAQTFPRGKLFGDRSSSDIQNPRTLHRDMSLFPQLNHGKQNWQKVGQTSDVMYTTEEASGAENIEKRDTSFKPSDGPPGLSLKALQTQYEQRGDAADAIQEPIHAMQNPLGDIGRSSNGIDEFVIQRRPMSAHPPPMKRNTPNIYFDRNPQGSSIGTHNFDSLVGLPDHSDPRTFHTPDSKDWPHVLAALQPSIEHFRKLTDGAEPDEMPLDSGYEVAHSLLQAHLRFWFVVNRPDYAHENAIPKLFKLERWEGGIEHWKFASNSPIRPTLTARPCYECTQRMVVCSGFQKTDVGGSKCNACREGGEAFKCTELLADSTSTGVAPVLQNYPACNSCSRDGVYCHGFRKDIRNRCEPCLKKNQICSYDMAGFERPIRI